MNNDYENTNLEYQIRKGSVSDPTGMETPVPLNTSTNKHLFPNTTQDSPTNSDYENGILENGISKDSVSDPTDTEIPVTLNSSTIEHRFSNSNSAQELSDPTGDSRANTQSDQQLGEEDSDKNLFPYPLPSFSGILKALLLQMAKLGGSRHFRRRIDIIYKVCVLLRLAGPWLLIDTMYVIALVVSLILLLFEEFKYHRSKNSD